MLCSMSSARESSSWWALQAVSRHLLWEQETRGWRQGNRHGNMSPDIRIEQKVSISATPPFCVTAVPPHSGERNLGHMNTGGTKCCLAVTTSVLPFDSFLAHPCGAPLQFQNYHWTSKAMPKLGYGTSGSSTESTLGQSSPAFWGWGRRGLQTKHVQADCIHASQAVARMLTCCSRKSSCACTRTHPLLPRPGSKGAAAQYWVVAWGLGTPALGATTGVLPFFLCGFDEYFQMHKTLRLSHTLCYI